MSVWTAFDVFSLAGPTLLQWNGALSILFRIGKFCTSSIVASIEPEFGRSYFYYIPIKKNAETFYFLPWALRRLRYSSKVSAGGM